jgi:hypothetical protein
MFDYMRAHQVLNESADFTSDEYKYLDFDIGQLKSAGVDLDDEQAVINKIDKWHDSYGRAEHVAARIKALGLVAIASIEPQTPPEPRDSRYHRWIANHPEDNPSSPDYKFRWNESLRSDLFDVLDRFYRSEIDELENEDYIEVLKKKVPGISYQQAQKVVDDWKVARFGAAPYFDTSKIPEPAVHNRGYLKQHESEEDDVGDVWKLETPQEDIAAEMLSIIAEKAMEGNKKAQKELEDLWDMEWNNILPKLEAEGSTWQVWWMDGVHAYIEKNPGLFDKEPISKGLRASMRAKSKEEPYDRDSVHYTHEFGDRKSVV